MHVCVRALTLKNKKELYGYTNVSRRMFLGLRALEMSSRRKLETSLGGVSIT